MIIDKVKIRNFKGIRELDIEFNEYKTIIVGNNDAGKSTILEAVHLAMTGYYHGHSILVEIPYYIFNKNAIEEYIESANSDYKLMPPEILIEVFFKMDVTDDEGYIKKVKEHFEGDNNTASTSKLGFKFQISLDTNFAEEYAELIQSDKTHELPLEYYTVFWETFARKKFNSPKYIPVKTILIDSSLRRSVINYDDYANVIIDGYLDIKQTTKISTEYRAAMNSFSNSSSLQEINKSLQGSASCHAELTPNQGTNMSWKRNILAQKDGIPLGYAGQGQQCIIKTELALIKSKTKKPKIVLIEEPENHLSHTSLNQFIQLLEEDCNGQQIILTTHSSFVANKLGLNELKLLADKNRIVSFKDLSQDDSAFFQRIAGYDTLRFALCKKAILVEGDSDELIVQRAYMDYHDGKLPIQDGIDVISVGTSFLRFLRIAEKLGNKVTVVTDNDGDLNALQKKYNEYLSGDNSNIKICYAKVTSNPLRYTVGKSTYNNNTLEPELVRANSPNDLNKIFNTSYRIDNELKAYMQNNKTECALKIFKAEQKIQYPNYILDAVK